MVNAYVSRIPNLDLSLNLTLGNYVYGLGGSYKKKKAITYKRLA